MEKIPSVTKGEFEPHECLKDKGSTFISSFNIVISVITQQETIVKVMSVMIEVLTTNAVVNIIASRKEFD